MNIKFFLLFCLLFINSFAYAGDKKGNGAGLVTCNDQTYLLDFYEGSLNEFKWEGSEVDLAKYLIQKIAPLSPVRFKNYKELIDSFFSEAKFVSESELGPISDRGDIKVPIPTNCKLVQGVIQKYVIFGSEKRYLINQVQWERLSKIHKAGIIIHEIIYRELQSPDSHRIRNFNNWLFSTGLDQVEPKIFYKNLMDAGFLWIYINNYPMDAQKLVIDDGPIRSRFSFPDMPFIIFNQKVMSKAHMVDSYLNGRPKVMQFSGKLTFENKQYVFNVCSKQTSTNCKINLTDTGKTLLLNNVDLLEKNSQLESLNKTVEFREDGEVEEIH